MFVSGPTCFVLLVKFSKTCFAQNRWMLSTIFVIRKHVMWFTVLQNSYKKNSDSFDLWQKKQAFLKLFVSRLDAAFPYFESCLHFLWCNTCSSAAIYASGSGCYIVGDNGSLQMFFAPCVFAHVSWRCF